MIQVINRLQSKLPSEHKAGFSTNNNGGRFQKGGRVEVKAVTPYNKEKGMAEAAAVDNRPTIEDRRNKPYSFRRDKVAKIFRDALRDKLPLPACKRPEDADKADQPNFCPYHRMLGHTIKDCYIFKDIIERRYRNGEIQLPASVLQDPAPHTYAQINMISHKGDAKSQYYV